MACYTQQKGKKFEAAEIEDETRDYCDLAMSEALEAWFPAASLTPGKQLIVAFGLAFGEQWVGRREITPDTDDPPDSSPAPAAATSSQTSSPRSPTPTPPPTPPQAESPNDLMPTDVG
jgi:hypothetical protein